MNGAYEAAIVTGRSVSFTGSPDFPRPGLLPQEVHSPIDAQLLGSVRLSDAAGARRAIEAAGDAHPAWERYRLRNASGSFGLRRRPSTGA